MDRLIAEEQLKDIFPYLDDTGSTQEEHDSNVVAFWKVLAKSYIELI